MINILKLHKKKILIIAALFFAVLCGIVAHFYMSDRKAEGETIQQQIDAAVKVLEDANYDVSDKTNIPYAGVLTEATYDINELNDWIALMVASYYYDLSEKTFYVENACDLRETAFEGISLNESLPFKGKLISKFGNHSFTIQTDCPLFGYLDASAVVGSAKTAENMLDIVVRDASSGLAQVLVGSGTADNIKNIYLGGTVINENGNAGAIFGEIKGTSADTALEIGQIGVTFQSGTITLSSVTGKNAGGLAGFISGNVKLNIDAQTNYANMTISGRGEGGSVGNIVGNIVGTSEKPVIVTIADGYTLPETVTLTGFGSMGGLFGYAEYANITFGAIGYSVAITNNTSDNTLGAYSGGLIGWTKNSTLTFNGLMTANTAIVKNTKNIENSYAAGVVGYIDASEVTFAAGTEITSEVRGYYAGGFAGRISNCNSDNQNITMTALTIKGTGEASVTGLGFLGGVAGSIENSSIQATSITTDATDKINDAALYAGGVVGYAKSASLNMGVVNLTGMSITSSKGTTNVGGVAGYLEDTNPVYTSITSSNMTVRASQSANTIDTYVGGIVGHYKDNNTEYSWQNITISGLNVSASGSAYNNYVGGIIGYIEGNAKTIITNVDVTIINSSSNNSKTYFGGIVGGNNNSNLIINGDATSNVKIKLVVSGTFTPVSAYAVGGVIGRTQARCVLQNIVETIPAITSAGVLGGVVAVIDDNIAIEISNVSFSSIVLAAQETQTSHIGGIVGDIGNKSVLALNGNIQFLAGRTSSGNGFGYYGLIAGYQNNSLIYINPTSIDSDGKYVYGLNNKISPNIDEVGNYGSVYRNGDWDSATKTLDDKTSWMIQENADGSVHILADNDPYILATVGDVMRLAIALNTENNFTGLGSGLTTATLLSGTYTLSGDIDLTGTGILTINKNAQTASVSAYAFKGTLKGNGNNPTIKNSITAFFQPNLGLFSSVASGATFSNFEVDMTVSYPYNISQATAYQQYATTNNGDSQSVGGIAARAEGNITVSNVDVSVNLTEEDNSSKRSFADQTRYMAGVFGYYKPSESGTVSFSDITVNGTLKSSEVNHYAGGLIGYVDLSGITSATKATMNISNYTVGGNIIANMNGATAKIGGMIAGISDRDADNTSTDERLTLNITGDTNVNNLVINDSVTGSNTLDAGGLLGYKWKHVNATIEKIMVNGTSAISLSKHSEGATYGGLWNTVDGKLTIKSVALNGLSISVTGTASNKFNGLLVRNGQYLYLDLSNYSIATGNSAVAYSDTSSNYLDEIVGFNKGTSETDILSSTTGGIVSINRAVGEADYSLYTNKIINQNNPGTRYYYDLAADLGGTTNLSSNTLSIANKAQLLQWNLAHFANTELRGFFNIASGYTKTGEQVTFAESINLDDISYYPIDISGGTYAANKGVELTFNGASFDGFVTSSKTSAGEKILYSYAENSENYRIQSGLFGNVTQADINGLTLAGSVTAYQVGGVFHSGALITGTILGVVSDDDIAGDRYITYDTTPTNITNITLINLSVSHMNSGDSWNGYYGLLVNQIGSGATVNFGESGTEYHAAGAKGVTMTGYIKADTVAAALIGKVGSATAEGMNISFRNMKVADAANTAEVTSISRTNGSKVLALASFIYEYEYALDNTKGVYIFYKADYNDNVTLGSEIADKVQFYDTDLIDSIATITAENNDLVTYVSTNYKPYVYKNISEPKPDVDINPKNGDIIEGKGTYDDPYIINNATQLVSLYNYLFDKELNQNSLANWRVNQFGTDTINASENAVPNSAADVVKYYNIGSTKDADNNENANGVQSTYESLTKGGFPTVEQLNNAYYMIVNSIDLSSYPEFTGFGIQQRPFTGVFIGRHKLESGYDENPVCEITLPAPSTETDVYGFINYAKGVAIQNLTFNLKTADESVKIEQNGCGAGVIAYVVGGDNVIKNVSVNGTINAQSKVSLVGGYVGNLQMGSVILRGMTENSLKNFNILNTSGNYQHGIVGKTEDGYMIDEDGTTLKYSNDYTLTKTDNINLTGTNMDWIIQSSSFIAEDKIGVTASTTYEYTIPTANSMMILQLAMNSGSMNYMGNTTNNPLSYGYDKFSRCRNTNYDDVGVVGNTTNESFTKAVKYDNGNPYTKDGTADTIGTGTSYGATFYHPYIYQYFNFGTVDVMQGNTYESLSKINQQTSTAAMQAVYKLTGESYDLSVLKFKGIGSRYYNPELYCFQGSMTGLGSDKTTIVFNMLITDSRDASLFTILNTGSESSNTEYQISGFKIIGTITNTYQNGYAAASGIATMVYGKANYVFSDIVLDDLDITAIGDESSTSNFAVASGFIIRPQQYVFKDIKVTDTGKITFNRCSIQNNTVIKGKDTSGGFVAINTGNTKAHEFNNCSMISSEISTIRGNVGGFIGSFSANMRPSFIMCRIESSKIYVSETTVSTELTIGGFCGAVKGASFTDCYVGKSTDGVPSEINQQYNNASVSARHTGGFIGNSSGETTFTSCELDSVNITNNTNSPTGGFVGECISTLTVKTATDPGSKNTSVKNLTINNSYANANGGLVGNQTGATNVANVTITNAKITVNKSAENRKEGYIGGVFGQISNTASITDVTVQSGTGENEKTLFTPDLADDADQIIYTGGLIGRVNNGSGTTFKIDNCSVLGNETNRIYLLGCHTGGFIGSFTTGTAHLSTSFTNIGISNSKVENVDVRVKVAENASAINSTLGNINAAGGGMIGSLLHEVRIPVNITTPVITNVTVDYEGTTGKIIAAGGMIGYNESDATSTDYIITNLQIGTSGYIGIAGGVYGYLGDGNSVVSINNTTENKILNSTIAAGVAGGVIGEPGVYGAFSINDASVKNCTVLARQFVGNNWENCAGGVIGRYNNIENLVANNKNITITNSIITAYNPNTSYENNENTYLGGMVGKVNKSVVTKYYNISLSNALIGLMNNDVNLKQTIPTYDNVTNGEVKLYVSEIGSSITQKELSSGMTTNLIEPKYALNTGTFAGGTSTAETYIIKANVSYDEGLECYHPAMDVGITKTNIVACNSMTDAYNCYRPYYHIIYRDEPASITNNTGIIANSLGISDYHFADLETIYNASYNNTTLNNEKDNVKYRLEDNFNQTETDASIENVLALTYATTDNDVISYQSSYLDGNDNAIPMMVLSSGDYNVNTIINTALNVLTNNGGAENSVRDINTVTLHKMRLSGTTGNVTLKEDENINTTLSYNSKDGFTTNENYDQFTDAYNGTFTVVEISYSFDTNNKYTIYIPVCVKEMMKVESHVKGMAGAHYSISDVTTSAAEPTDNHTTVAVETQSVYTLYTEFAYSEVRENYTTVSLEKALYLTDNTNSHAPKAFMEGTKITLIDISNGSQSYYYEIPKNQVNTTENGIKFTEFKDNAGNPYNINNMGKDGIASEDYVPVCDNDETRANYGVERFLIIIDESDCENAEYSLYNAYVKARQEDNVSLFKNIIYNPMCYVYINEIPGLENTLSGSDKYNTLLNQAKESADATFDEEVEGKVDTSLKELSDTSNRISADGNVSITGNLCITSPNAIVRDRPNYWEFMKASKNDQYMEISVSVINSETKNKIKLPIGTKVTIQLDDQAAYSYYIVGSTEYVYCYRDSLINNQTDDGYLNIANLSANKYVKFDVSFDFSSATDFSDIETAQYTAIVELLNTSDFRYPRSGTAIDSVELPGIQGTNVNQIGFAVEPEDNISLGMNGETSDYGVINFKTRLDFSDFITYDEENNSWDYSSQLNSLNGKYFTYTFVIQKKETVDNKFTYTDIDTDTGNILLYDGKVSLDNILNNSNSEAAIVMKTVRYTADKALTEQNNITNENTIMEQEFSLCANVKELLTQIGTITNYKVKCYVTITDTNPTDKENTSDNKTPEEIINNKTAEDFFIFTVAKLKTDLD